MIIEIIIDPKKSIRNTLILISYVFFGLLVVYSHFINFDFTIFTFLILFVVMVIETIYCIIKKLNNRLTWFILILVLL